MPFFGSLGTIGRFLFVAAVVVAVLSEISTLVGAGISGYYDGSVKFQNPSDLVIDSSGTMYVMDTYNHRVRRITSAGVVTTFVGSGNVPHADGTGTNASIYSAYGIASDLSGNLYVSEYGGQVVDKITPEGVLTTLAGRSGTEGYADGTGTNAQFRYPQCLDVDSFGNVYLADTGNHRIRRISPTGVVTTFAGSGSVSSVDGFGTNASFNAPHGLAIDSAQNIYVSDAGSHCIRKIVPDIVTTLAGSGSFSFADGIGTAASFNNAGLTTVDSIGNLYVPDVVNHRIRKITSSGVVTTIAGSGTAQFADGTGAGASFNQPNAVTIDSVGNLYVSDRLNHRIRKIVSDLVSTLVKVDGEVSALTVDSLGNVYSIYNSRIYKTTPAGVSTVFAGDGSLSFQDATGTSAGFRFPYGLTCDSAGNVYVADFGNHRIRKITSGGNVTTLAGNGTVSSVDGTGTNATFNCPAGVAVDSGGTIYVVEQSNRIRKITSGGVVTTVAGNGTIGSTDGTGTNATFNYPQAITVDSAGNLYVADVFNASIRKITPSGIVSTLAGGGFGTFADGAGTNAAFWSPRAVAVDSTGSVYVADAQSNRIRKITPAGLVSTFAGTGQFSSFIDGPSSSATFYSPQGIAVDSVGNVYVGDYSNRRIRKITVGSTVTTLAGNGTPAFADGIPTSASFNTPQGIAVDSTGTVYVTDNGNRRIRKIANEFVTTLAGSGTPQFADGSGTNASFFNPHGVAFDSVGNVYLGDSNNRRIRKITPDGVVTTFAGSTGGYADGTGTNARFRFPTAVAVDSNGTLYVADTSDHRIRKVTPAGVVTTFAGSGTGGGTGTGAFADGTGTNASFNNPYGVAVDSLGNVYVADSFNHRIRKIVPSGEVIPFAGSGTETFANGTGTNASFAYPQGIAVDSAGNVYVGDTANRRIRRITPAGVVSTFAGSGSPGSTDGTGTNASFNGPSGLSFDSFGILYVVDGSPSHTIRRITPAGVVTTLAGGSIGSSDGTGTNASFSNPLGLVVDSTGIVYVADNGNHSIRKIITTVSTLAGQTTSGSADGTGSNAQFSNPRGIAVNSSGTVYVVDTGNQRIRAITPAGVVTTLAGSTFGNADGTGTNAKFHNPVGIAVNSLGNLYVTDQLYYSIRIITSAGVVTTLAVTGTSQNIDGIGGTSSSFQYPNGIAIDSVGNIYVNSAVRIRKIPVPAVSTFAGYATAVGYLDGLRTNANFNTPIGLAVDSAGNVYVADMTNQRVRKITPQGLVTTLAGNGLAAFSDGTGTNASFSDPRGVSVDSAGNVYVADYSNNCIRKITPAGVVTTFAGVGVLGYTDSVQNGAVSGALLNLPRAVAVDSSSTMYVADTTNHRIRKITSAGVVTTLAGSGTATFADGTGTNASFNSPQGITVDSAGVVYVSDTLNNRIRSITPAGVVTTIGGNGLTTFADGRGTNATFNNPYGITVDSTGTLYVVDKLNYRVRKILTKNIVSTLGTGLTTPNGVTIDSSGNIYIADTNAHRIRRVTSTGTVTIVAGSGTAGSTNATGTNATFRNPQDITIDVAGNLYVADTNNHLIRRITSAGIVTTLAGTGTAGFVNGTGTGASFNSPQGITIDSDGALYVGDTSNNNIRKIALDYVSTFAGSGTSQFADGTGAGASFGNPHGVAVDSTGTLYVTDYGNHRIRAITPEGVVTTIGGNGTTGHTDGTGTNAAIGYPLGIALDSVGNLYVSSLSGIIRKITMDYVAVTTYAGNGLATTVDGAGTNASLRGPQGITLDSSGTIYFTNENRVRKMTTVGVVSTFIGNGTSTNTEGTGTNASILDARGLRVDSTGNVFVCGLHCIYRITPAGVMTTFVGRFNVQGSTDGTGTNATFNNPLGIAIDSVGNLYIADDQNHRIRKVTPSGVVSTLAGSTVGYTDGTGTNAKFNRPFGIAIDNTGNLYVSDVMNFRIRKVTPDGVVTTFAEGFGYTRDIVIDSSGNFYVSQSNYRIAKVTPAGVVSTFVGDGTAGYLDGTGTNARIQFVVSLAIDSSDNLYLGDAYLTDRIRKVTPAGVVTTIAGTSSQGFADGPATSAIFNYPSYIASDSDGILYVNDYSNFRIRKIIPEAVVTTIAGSTAGFANGTGTNAQFYNPRGLAVDSTKNIYVCDFQSIRKITPAGVVTTFAGGTPGYADGTGTNSSFSYPESVVIDSSDNLYVGDSTNYRIRKITPTGVVTTFAGSGSQETVDGTGTNASFYAIIALTIDSVGNLYAVEVSSSTYSLIRKITPAGVVTTVAGNFSRTFGDGTGTNASFSLSWGIAVDSGGNLYVADTNNNRIRAITPTGVVRTLAGTATSGSANGNKTNARFWNPNGVAVDSAGTVYVADGANNLIRKIVPVLPQVTTLAGDVTVQGFQDGTGTNARFNTPYGVAVDSAGNVYVGDSFNHRIRKITPSGVVTTLAGSGIGQGGATGAFADGTGTNASFSYPFGLAVDSGGNVYLTEYQNHRIRKVTPDGVVTTFAGTTPAYADGTGTNASFSNPSGLTIDSSGNLYVCSTNRIRKVTSAAVVTTLAGTGSSTPFTNGPASNAIFNSPFGVAVDSLGNVYVADTNNHRIRKLVLGGTVVTTFTSDFGFLTSPTKLAFDSVKNLYISDTGNHQIVKVSPIKSYTFFAGFFTSGYLDARGTNARFNSPQGITTDSAGNVYVGDSGNNRIRVITPAGVVTTFAGTGSTTFADGEALTTATFNGTYGLVFDSAGSLYIGDYNNTRVRKITPIGTITTLAGNGTAQYLEGTGTGARFLNPFGIVVNSAGTLMYVTDSNYIRRITSAGVTTFIAGQATAGSTNATGASASFSGPREIALLAAGTSVYVADTGNHIIRRVTTDFGVTTKYSGFGGAGFRETPVANVQYNTPSGIAVNSAGLVYVADTNNNRIRTIAAGSDNTGVVTTVVGTSTAGYTDGGGWFNSPFGVATDWDGTVYVADTINNYIRKITPAGVVTSLAGNGAATFADGTGTSASFNQPRGVALGSDGTVYVADTTNNRIRRITPAGVVTIVAGNTSAGNTNGTGTSALLSAPNAITVNSAGIMYVADTGNHRIRAITQARVVTTFAGNTQTSSFSYDGVGTNSGFNSPRGIVADMYGNLYVADTGNHRIRRITSNGTVTTFAGSISIGLPDPGFVDGIGTNAKFNFPTHLSIDALGTLYVADQNNNRIRTIQTSTGVVSTLAGDGTAGFTPSRFNSPFGITVERFRNAYIADTNNHSIRKIPNAYTLPENNGVVTTFAGDGTAAFLDGTGIGARFLNPEGVAFDPVGNIYVADNGSHRIRKITPDGVVTSLAGGNVGFLDGTGIGARFNYPSGVSVDSVGNLYVGDRGNHRIRKVTSVGVVTTLAGSGTPGLLDGTGTNSNFQYPGGVAVDSVGNVYVGDWYNHCVRKITPAGVVTSFGNGAPFFADGAGTNARFFYPDGVAVDSAGTVYVADRNNNRIRKITPAGVVTTFAGSSSGYVDGTGTNAKFNDPYGVTLDSAGNVYVTEGQGSRIRKITSAGVVTTLAGTGTATFSNGTGTNAGFNLPFGVAVDSAGNVYIGDYSNHRIRKIGSGAVQFPLNAGVVTTFAGDGNSLHQDGTGIGARFRGPAGVAFDSSGVMYVGDFHRMRKITPAGVVTTFVGNGTEGHVDATGTNARISTPTGIKVDSNGVVYFVSGNAVIRKITPAGVVTTLAGVPTYGVGTFADGTGTNARFSYPRDIVIDSIGNLYVTDRYNHRIRKITPAGVVTTLAGSGIGEGTGNGAFADGTGTNASFDQPTGIVIDKNDNLYVGEFYNTRIRKITPAGVVTTLAGTGGGGARVDGTGTNARFQAISGLTIDSNGIMYAVERGEGSFIRKITPAGVVTTLAGYFIEGYRDGLPFDAQFNSPESLAVNSNGIIFVTDAVNYRIRKVE